VLAADLVSRKVVVIVAYTDAAVFAAKAATTIIPIVFLSGSDPVGGGIVPSLNRPGESITGVSWFGSDLVPKQLALLHELVPNAAVIGLLVDLNTPGTALYLSEVQAVAHTLRLQLIVLNARTASDIDVAFANLVRDRASALVVGAGGFLVSRRDLPVEQATAVVLKINLKTAKALGLTVPPSLLARADEVIE
jgi:putative ABC transport system substrate-binding protein